MKRFCSVLLILLIVAMTSSPTTYAADGYTHTFSPTYLTQQNRPLKEWLSVDGYRTLFSLLLYCDIANSAYNGELDINWTYNVYLGDVYGIAIAAAYRLSDNSTLIATYSPYLDCTYVLVSAKQETRAEYKADIEAAFAQQEATVYEVTAAEIMDAMQQLTELLVNKTN